MMGKEDRRKTCVILFFYVEFESNTDDEDHMYHDGFGRCDNLSLIFKFKYNSNKLWDVEFCQLCDSFNYDVTKCKQSCMMLIETSLSILIYKIWTEVSQNSQELENKFEN